MSFDQQLSGQDAPRIVRWSAQRRTQFDILCKDIISSPQSDSLPGLQHTSYGWRCSDAQGHIL